MKKKIFIDNTSEAPRKARARDIVFYLDEIRKTFCFEFDKLEVVCTDGDIRPPYPYQWRALAKHRPGDDDPFEGVGDTPLKAIHDLWKSIKSASNYQEEE